MRARSSKVMFLVAASMLALAFASMAQAKTPPPVWQPAPVPSQGSFQSPPRHHGANGGAPSYYGQDPERDYPGLASCRDGVIYSGAPCVEDIPYGPR